LERARDVGPGATSVSGDGGIFNDIWIENQRIPLACQHLKTKRWFSEGKKNMYLDLLISLLGITE
jgi:hypothetical protein